MGELFTEAKFWDHTIKCGEDDYTYHVHKVSILFLSIHYSCLWANIFMVLGNPCQTLWLFQYPLQPSGSKGGTRRHFNVSENRPGTYGGSAPLYVPKYDNV
jgi:hypothetical protein